MAKKLTYEELKQKVKDLEKEIKKREDVTMRKDTTLHRKAEEFINKYPSTIKKIPPKEIQFLVEDLEVHKTELEIQNEKLHSTQLKLKTALGKYADLYDSAPVGYFSIDNEGKILDVNIRGAAMLGMEQRLLTGRPFSDFIARDDQDIFYLHRQELAETKSKQTCELRLVKKNGSHFFAHLECIVIFDKEGALSQIRMAISDINDRKEAEQALRESEEKYSSFLNNLVDGAYETDDMGNVRYANEAVEEIVGKPLKDIIGKAFLPLFTKASQTIAIDAYSRSLNKEDVGPFELEFANGRVCQFKNALLKDKDGNIIGVFGIMRNISKQKLAEKALRESEERFRTVADFTYNWEYWIAPDGQHLYVSPSCERITGYNSDEFLNDHGLLEKIVHPDDQSTFVSHMCQVEQQKGIFALDFRIITRNGEERWISHACQPVYGPNGRYLGQRASNRDISKQKLIQEELLKAKKLESLGVLAGGIAHDFNNLLTSVVGYISLARIDMKPGSKAFQNLGKAEKVSIQTKELTARLITFSEGGGPVKETVSIGNLIKDSVGSLLKGSDMSCKFAIPDDISPAEVDEDQMKQVIHNIITNAREAMAGQGTINVSCENVNIGEKDPLTLKNGKYVKISIEDQGPGIPDEDLGRIFDPYFSTKDMGTQKGIGLGLAVSDSIVKKHDGLITVESELGAGTILSIYLPASEKEIEAAAPVKKPVPEISETQEEKILVMDDEEVVRDVCNALLTHLGYEADVAVDGVEAIEMYGKAMESEKPFDIVILDLTNKIGMGGAETIVKLLEIDPDVKAIVATGYSNDPIMSNFREHGFRGALPKPFTLDQLKTALHDAISRE